MERIDVTIYTDGACKGNPGPGGYCAILVCRGHEKVVEGGSQQTTNNRMELTAVTEAVKALNKPCDVHIVTDSKYVMMSKDKWRRWSLKRDIPNGDVWKELFSVAKAGNHKLHYEHVDGHSGHIYNERCDRLARAQAVRFSRALLMPKPTPIKPEMSCSELIKKLMEEEKQEKLCMAIK